MNHLKIIDKAITEVMHDKNLSTIRIETENITLLATSSYPVNRLANPGVIESRMVGRLASKGTII